jgi:hypothetical protein
MELPEPKGVFLPSMKDFYPFKDIGYDEAKRATYNPEEEPPEWATDLMDSWFYQGLEELGNDTYSSKSLREKIIFTCDYEKMIHISSLMRSWLPSHETKRYTVALLISKWANRQEA